MHNKKTPVLVSTNTALTDTLSQTAIKHSEQAAAIQASGQVWDAGEQGRRGRMRQGRDAPEGG